MIVAQDVELRAGARILLEHATFRVGPGDRVGLVGRNGAGKTTLTRVLAGEGQPAAGTVTRSGDIGYLPQDPRTGDLEVLARDRVLSARGLSKSYGSLEIFTDVDLAIDRGSRVVVLGLNGAGKTTLLRLLGGMETPDTGEVLPGHGLRLGYYAQEHETLDVGRTVLENMRSAAPDLADTQVRSVLGSFLFSGDDVDKPAGVGKRSLATRSWTRTASSPAASRWARLSMLCAARALVAFARILSACAISVAAFFSAFARSRLRRRSSFSRCSR